MIRAFKKVLTCEARCGMPRVERGHQGFDTTNSPPTP